MAEVTKPADLLKQIVGGKYDGHLVEIVTAIQGRYSASNSRKLWKINFDGDEWTEETVTLGEVTMAERALELSWLEIDPAEVGAHLATLIAAHIAKRDDVNFSDGLAKAEAMPMGDLLSVLSHYEKTDAPKD